jgi:hypothetical protein
MTCSSTLHEKLTPKSASSRSPSFVKTLVYLDCAPPNPFESVEFASLLISDTDGRSCRSSVVDPIHRMMKGDLPKAERFSSWDDL